MKASARRALSWIRRIWQAAVRNVRGTWRHPLVRALVWSAAFAAGLGAVLALGYFVVKTVPSSLDQPKGLDAGERATERGAIRTAAVTYLAGVVAAVGAFWAGRTFLLSRRGQMTDRFTKAIDHLGDNSLDKRLGGVYALEQLARDSRTHHLPVVEVLAAYVHERGKLPDPPPPTSRTNVPSAAADILAAMKVLARRRTTRERGAPRLDLTGTDLRRIDADGIQLEGSRLVGAFLQRAQLQRANLTDVSFHRAHLEDAELHGAQLNGARFRDAHLEGTNFQDAVGLEKADLQGATFDTSTHWGDRFSSKKAKKAGAIEVDAVQGQLPAGPA